MKTFMDKLPFTRPEIRITPQKDKSFSVMLDEFPWMFCLPAVGQQTVWGMYDQPNWSLTDCTITNTQRAAKIHEIDCVEVELSDFSSPTNPLPDNQWKLYLHADEDQMQMVASARMQGETLIFQTMLDEAFLTAWGPAFYRKIEDMGFTSYNTPDLDSIQGCEKEIFLGAGVYAVTVGERSFNCLRVLNRWAGDPLVFSESYISQEGRTVLFRRYNHPDWREQHWDQKFPTASAFFINGQKYIHWYDCLSDYVF